MKSQLSATVTKQVKKLHVRIAGLCLIICMGVLAISCSKDKPTEATSNPKAVSWTSGTISLKADDFYIQIDSTKYLAKVSNLSVGGSSSTLELEWTENAKDMRLFIYFESDSVNWWSDEIRTYDGAMNDGTRWVYYFGEFFKSARGAQFQGDVDLTSSGSDNGVTGHIYFKNLRLTAL